MFSHLHGYIDDDELDAIFNLNDIIPGPIKSTIINTVANNEEAASEKTKWTFESALQTPKCDSFSSRLMPHSVNRNGGSNSDSAFGTESQMTKINAESNQGSTYLLNRMTNENFDSQPICSQQLSMGMDQEKDVSLFLNTQDEMFFLNLTNSSMDVTSDGCLSQCNYNVRQTSNDSFINRDSSMQTSSMNHSFELPSSSLQQALLTPRIENQAVTVDSQNSRCNNLSQKTSYSTTGFLISGCTYQRFQENDCDAPTQRRASTDLLSSSIDDPPRRFMESHIISNVSSLPESIIDLYEQIKSADLSDWSFVYALSAQACQEFMPMNYNVSLKTSLLLSLASIDVVSVKIFKIFLSLLVK